MAAEEFFERVRREMEELIKEIEEEFLGPRPMWNSDGSMEPLLTILDKGDHYEVVIDLPMADLRSLSIEVRGRRMLIECTLAREITFPRWSVYGETRFKRYRTEITLPEDADTGAMEVRKDEERKMVIVVFPKK